MSLPTIHANFAFEHRVPAGLSTPANGYTATLIINGPSEYSFNAAYDATTSTWVFNGVVADAGTYRYAITFNNVIGRFLYESGRADVLADPTTALDTDIRSFAERTLEVVEAVLEKKATKDQLSYSIAGRSITKYSFKELMDLRKQLRLEISLEKKKTPKAIIYKFTRG